MGFQKDRTVENRIIVQEECIYEKSVGSDPLSGHAARYGAGRFFRRRLCHLPHGRKMPFGSGVDTLHPVIDPPSEETYDLHTGMRLEHKYSDWELMRAGVDGELRPYPQQQYRFSLSDGWRSD